MASLVTKFNKLLDLLNESTYSEQPLNFTDIHSLGRVLLQLQKLSCLYITL